MFKQIVSDMISEKKFQNSTSNEMKKILDSITFDIPAELSVNSSFFVSGNISEHNIENISLLLGTNTLIKRIKKMHDGTFLVMVDGGAIKHYSSGFSLIGDIPFKYVVPGGANLDGYIDPKDIEVITFSLSGIVGSYLFVVQDLNHVIQVYKYTDGVWSFVVTIGTLDVAGNNDSDLDGPIAVSGIFKTLSSNESFFEIYVSCTGNADNSEVGFIKKIVLKTDNTIDIAKTKIISYPRQVVDINSVNKGSLLLSETSDVTRLKILPGDKLSVILNTKKEFGILQLSENELPATIYMTKNNIQDNQYDSIKNPQSFDVSGNRIITGDESGHISVLSEDLKNVLIYFGRKKEAGSSFPNEFENIDDILIDGNFVYFISGMNLYKSNILSVNDSTLLFRIPANTIKKEYRIQDFFGNQNYQLISFSYQDDINSFTDFSDWRNKTINEMEDLYIKVIITKEDILKYDVVNPKICLILSLECS